VSSCPLGKPAQSCRCGYAVVLVWLVSCTLAATAHGSEQPVDLVNREGFGIEVIADPLAHFTSTTIGINA